MGNKRNNEVTLGTLKFVDFYGALIDNDYKKLNIDEDSWLDLSGEFGELIKSKPNSLEKQLEKLDTQVRILLGCLTLLSKKWDDDVVLWAEDCGVVIQMATFDEDLIKLGKFIKSLKSKITLLQTQLPLEPNAGKDKSTAYDILAGLSTGLGFGVDFNMTVLEYVGFKNALSRNNEAMKNSKKK